MTIVRMEKGETMRLIDADAIPELFDKEYKVTRLLIEQGEEHIDNLAEAFSNKHDEFMLAIEVKKFHQKRKHVGVNN